MSKYLLMNKNSIVATFDYDTEITIQYGIMPLGFDNTKDWLRSRCKLNSIYTRKNLNEFLEHIGVKEVDKEPKLEDCINKTYCISIHDTYWVKREDDNTVWEDISPYTNPHSEIVSVYSLEDLILSEKPDHIISPIFTLGGSAPCAIERRNNKLYYIKAGCKYTLKIENSKSYFIRVGDKKTNEEATFVRDPFAEYYASVIAEYYASVIAKYLHFNAVDYSIKEHIKHDGTKQIVTECELFTDETYGSIEAECIKDLGIKSGGLNKISTGRLISYCKNLSDKAYNTFLDTLFLDCITLNNDRHTQNIMFITNNDTQEIIDLAPIFDYNCAFLAAYQEETSRMDLMRILIKFNKTVAQTCKLIKQYKDYTKELQALKQLKLTEPVGVPISTKKLQCFNDILQVQVRYLEQIQ